MAETIINDVFGRLTWDSQSGCWLGAIDWPAGSDTEVAICQPDDDVAAALRTARDSLDWLQTNERHARWCVAWALLDAYNEAWRTEEEPLTADEFVRRLELVRAGFEADGGLILSYVGPDLFGDQTVEAEFDPARSFVGADLVE